MKWFRWRWLLAALLCALFGSHGLAKEESDARSVDVRSPHGRNVVTVHTDEGRLRYDVSRDGQTVLKNCELALLIEDAPPLGPGCRIVAVEKTEQRKSWRPTYGERATIPDRYNGLKIDLQDTQSTPRRLRIVLRIYDEGVALRYEVPSQEALSRLRLSGETTQFRFAADHHAWVTYQAQGEYDNVALSQIRPGCERPLVVQVADDLYAAVAEASLVDSARMKLAPIGEGVPGVVSQLSSAVVADAPWKSPWRVVMLADSAAALLEQNYLILNLNEPCAIEDTSWIKPGKVIREVTLTTTGGKSCVDFAVENNLQYVEFDAGWYGHEYDDQSDATTIRVDPKRSAGPLDLLEVIRYGQQRGIGIILYVNRRALEQQLDEILPLYERWGVKGVKYGFVRVGSQEWTSWLHAAVRKAAEHRLMIDVHDEYRPTGYSRTYPNLMTQEGIRGDEAKPTNQLTLTILFTRMLAGAGDNTVCYYDPRVTENACHAYQLAKTVCLYSPWQFLFWYDRPLQAGETDHGMHRIGDEPELEFFRHVPTVWDETRVLHGRIGQYAVIARRSGEDWYIGCMNGQHPRTLPVSLDFLNQDKQYRAHIYRHDPTFPTRTHVRIDRMEVEASQTIDVTMGQNQGEAIRIECLRH